MDCCERDVVRTQAVEWNNKPKLVLGFKVADVQKSLLSMNRIVEKGNVVQFGPRDGDNLILNEVTGYKILLKPNGKGSYLVEVSLLGRRDKTWISMDSGAAENVCPWDWGSQFGIVDPPKWMSFRNASGGLIDHYGMRVVQVEATF